jgi:hypothetical protein
MASCASSVMLRSALLQLRKKPVPFGRRKAEDHYQQALSSQASSHLITESTFHKVIDITGTGPGKCSADGHHLDEAPNVRREQPESCLEHLAVLIGSFPSAWCWTRSTRQTRVP